MVFGFLSRRCERQADVYGCRAVSCGRPDCVGHDDGAALAPRAAALCGTGVRTFIYALEKVAQVNGISRDRPGFFQSWQHGSIARRVAFLYGLLKDPSAEARFQRRVALVKWGLFVVLGRPWRRCWRSARRRRPAPRRTSRRPGRRSSRRGGSATSAQPRPAR